MRVISRARLHRIIEADRYNDPASRVFDLTIMALIALNVVAVIVETVPAVTSRFHNTLAAFDLISVAIFSAEYVMRVWLCTEDERYRRPILGRLRYMVSPMALVDLIAIAPFFLPVFISMDLRELRAIRLFRLFRALKLLRYTRSSIRLRNVLLDKRDELAIVFFTQTILLLVIASLVYHAEHAAQPEKFSSIPASMWWAVVTLTTVGYGDIAPVTPLGKVFAGLLAVVGVAMFAVPAGILASGFAQQAERAHARPAPQRDELPTTCPHCGGTICSGGDRRDDGTDPDRHAPAEPAAPELAAPDSYWQIVDAPRQDRLERSGDAASLSGAAKAR